MGFRERKTVFIAKQANNHFKIKKNSPIEQQRCGDRTDLSRILSALHASNKMRYAYSDQPCWRDPAEIHAIQRVALPFRRRDGGWTAYGRKSFFLIFSGRYVSATKLNDLFASACCSILIFSSIAFFNCLCHSLFLN